MKEYFGTWKKAVGFISLVVIGMVTWAFVNKNFNVESNIPKVTKG